MEIMIHPRVNKFISESGEKEKIKKHLKNLADNPYHSKGKVDIKKLKGKKHDLYRLKLGDFRFEYFMRTGNQLLGWARRLFFLLIPGMLM